MNQKTSYLPVVFLTTSWICVLISLYLEAIWGQALFSRSGSLMVLFAIMAEYNLLKVRNGYHRDQLKTYAAKKQVNFDHIHPSINHQYQETAAHITVVVGTIIWGYGDIFFP